MMVGKNFYPFLFLGFTVSALIFLVIPKKYNVYAKSSLIKKDQPSCPITTASTISHSTPHSTSIPSQATGKVNINFISGSISCTDEEGKPCHFASQGEEDKLLMTKYFTDQASQKRGEGVIVEIGGNDGITFSNSYFFERYLGWKSILIEPSRIAFPKLLVNRPNAIKLNMAACKEWTKLTFLEDSGNTPVSGVEENLHEGFKNYFHPKSRGTSVRYDVTCGPLSVMFKVFGISSIDIFSIDVEGSELFVLESVDWKSIKVHYVLIELDGGNAEKDQKCRDFLLGQGFELLGKLGTTTANELFVNKTMIV